MSNTILSQLKRSVGKSVAVTWSSVPLTTHGFHTLVSVFGDLEHKPDTDEYRVVIDDDNYAYFRADDIEAVIPYSKGLRFYIRKDVT